MKNFNLQKMISIAATNMQSELQHQLIDHPGETGTDREEIIRHFLRKYLPKRFDISTGFVFDSKGQVSKQMDIIIADSDTSPIFESSGKKRFYPCESVVAIGQIKSSLTSEAKLINALENLESAKKLDRSANGRSTESVTGVPLDNTNNYLHQIFSFLIVTGRAISRKHIHEYILSYITEVDANLWPNVMLALDNYLLTFCCQDGICPNPMHAEGIALQAQTKEIDVLMKFYLLLGRSIEAIGTSKLPYWEYLMDATKWDAEVIHSTRDHPPQLLKNLPGFKSSV